MSASNSARFPEVGQTDLARGLLCLAQIDRADEIARLIGAPSSGLGFPRGAGWIWTLRRVV